LKGQQTAWGIADNAAGPYDSLAHAVRVIAGRWELGPDPSTGHPLDPVCGGVREADLLLQAYGYDLSARHDDMPILTRGQSFASDLMRSAGIVIPSQILKTTPVDQLRGAISDQLIGNVALANNLPTTNLATVLGTQGDAIRQMLANVDEADLRFA